MTIIAAVVQARMGSTRLPGKVAKKIADKPLLAHLLTRLKQAKKLDLIVVATSKKSKDDRVEEIADVEGVKCYRGSEKDVLSRYLEAAEEYEIDVIVRITGDCPLIDPVTVDKLIEGFLESGIDYRNVNVREEGYPRGLDAEVFFSRTLLSAAKMLKEKKYEDYMSYREHVTPCIYGQSDYFSLNKQFPPSGLKRDYRLCVDEPADFKLINKIYERLYKEDNGIIDIQDVIKLLDNNPGLAKINSNVKQKKFR